MYNDQEWQDEMDIVGYCWILFLGVSQSRTTIKDDHHNLGFYLEVEEKTKKLSLVSKLVKKLSYKTEARLKCLDSEW